jgi:hypothetical protein
MYTLSRRVDVRQAVGRRNNCPIHKDWAIIYHVVIKQHDKRHVVPTSLSELRVGKRKI